MSPKFHPVVAKINEKIALEGGELLRGRPIEGGRMQYWVKRGNGDTVSAPTVIAIADELGIDRKEPVKVSQPSSNLVDVHRASTLSGYSATAIHRARQTGDLHAAPMPGTQRPLFFDRNEVLNWSEAKKKQGGPYGPRRSRSAGPSAAEKNGARSPGKPRHSRNLLATHVSHSRVNERLDRYLQKLEGTPLEMSKVEFIEKVLDQALRKMGA